jgi:molybdate transport system permease protein
MTAARASARFYLGLALLGGVYVALIVAMLVADLQYATPGQVWDALRSREIRYAIKLSLVSCVVTTVLSLWVAVPLGYLLSRTRFYGKPILDTLLDIPIVLPPLVVGLSLLILFQTPPGRWIEDVTAHYTGYLLTYIVMPAAIALACWPLLRWGLSKASRAPAESGTGVTGASRLPAFGLESLLYLAVLAVLIAVGLRFSGLGTAVEVPLQERFGTRITFQIPSVILAQFAVSAAFAVRTMRVAFDQISPRTEQVALTLGCTRGQAFWSVALPEAWRGVVTAGTIAWARALGEFGPILIFAGATRMRTEVLSTTVFLELSVGHLNAAIAVSLVLIVVAVITLLLIRGLGLRGAAI